MYNLVKIAHIILVYFRCGLFLIDFDLAPYPNINGPIGPIGHSVSTNEGYICYKFKRILHQKIS